MDDLRLQVAYRDVLGKKARFLRRKGVTPTHLFGHDMESLALQCDTAQLERMILQAGMTRPISLVIENEEQSGSVFIREIQRDAIKRQLLHVDFYQVRKGEKIKVDVPIVLVGEAPAIKAKGGMLTQAISSLNIECLPGNIPPHIDIDLSSLQDLEQAIRVKDIVLGPDITVNVDPEQLVVKVSEIIVEKVEEVVKPEVEVKAEAEAGAEAEAEAEAPAGKKPEPRTSE